MTNRIAFGLHIAILLLLLGLDESTSAANRNDATNVVFILADDLGYGDVGTFGCPDIETPHLDRLAAEGVKLTSNYSNSAVCSPTRAAFITGRYFQRVGLEWAVWYQAPGEGLPPQEVSLATMLKQAGYATAMSGKWHLGYGDGWRPMQHGFDRFFGCLGGNINYFDHYDKTDTHDLFLDDQPLHEEGYATDLTANYAVQFIEQMQQPFFLYVAFNAPHFPFQGPADDGVEFTWHEGTRADHYVPMVESLDQAVGRIVAAIDDSGRSQNTLIVFTSDNGGEKLARNAPLRGRKGSLWEGGIRVPAIARWSGRIPPGSVCDEPVQTIDWSATIMNLAGVQPPKNRPLDGKSLVSVLCEEDRFETRPLFFRRALDPHRGNVQPSRAVRYGKWKYIDTPNGERYLFDLQKDIGEGNNLISEKPMLAARLRTLLDDWEREVDPPLYNQRAQAIKNKASRSR